MLIIVIFINLLISVFCLYVARRIRKWRRAISRAADVVDRAERRTYAVLHGAPRPISQGQLGISKLTERYQELEIQWQQVERVLRILGLVQRVWGWSVSTKTQRSRSQW